MAKGYHSQTYLIKNRHGYYFRIRIPEDIQPYLGKKELRYALKTDYFLEAKEQAGKLADHSKMMFEAVRRGKKLRKYSEKELRNIVYKWWVDFSNTIEDIRIQGEYEIHAAMGTGQGVKDFLPEPGKCLAKGDYSRIGVMIQRLISANGLEITEGEPEYNMLCREWLKAKVKFDRLEEARSQGDYDSDIEEVFKIDEHKQQVIYKEEPKEPEIETPTLDEVAKDFWNWGVNVEKWKPRSQDDYRKGLDSMLDFLGRNRMIHTITDQDMVAYRESIYEMGLSLKRNQFYMGRCNMFFKYAIEEKRLLPKGFENPVNRLIPKNKKKGKSNSRRPFDGDDLKKLFHSDQYLKDKHKEPYQFWLPMLALYTGARLEELCQLYIKDVRQVDGVWVIDINEDRPDKSVKNGEQRFTPLHPFLTDQLKFPGYVKSLTDQEGRVFPELKRVSHKYGHYPSRWFSRYKKACGLDPTPNVKVFHSFRRTMISHLTSKGVPLYQLKQVVGHSEDSDITIGTYSEIFTPDVLMKTVVKKLDYGIDFSHLKNSKYVRR